MSGPISGKLFWRRAKQLIAALPDADCILILRGGAVRGEPFRRSSALQAFLTGKEFANACFLISKKKFYALAGRHCAEQLLPITRGAPAGHTATLDDCVPQNDVNGDKIAQLVKEIQGFKKLALIECDLPHVRGEHFAERIIAEVRACGVATTCCAAATAAMLRIKDAVELDSVKKGGLFMSTLWNKVVLKELRERAEHARTEIDHADFAALVMVAIKDPALANVKGFPPDGTQGALTAPAMDTIVQSGKCSLTVQEKATSDGDELTIGTALLYTSVRFDQYCVCLGRTVMVDPSDEQRKAYQAALAARAAAIDCLRHGRRLSEAREKALERLPANLREHLVAEIGWGTGLELRDDGLLLSAACPATAAAGQCIAVHIGLRNLVSEGTPYAIQLVDTVIVPPEGAADPIIVTGAAKLPADAVIWGRRGGRPNDQWRDEQKAILEANRVAWQQHSSERGTAFIHAELLCRGILMKPTGGTAPLGNTPHVDVASRIVSLPLSGHLVPFHGSAIRNAVVTRCVQHSTLTVEFYANRDYPPVMMFPKQAMIKQLSFRVQATKHEELMKTQKLIEKVTCALSWQEGSWKRSQAIKVPLPPLQLRPGGPSARLRDVVVEPKIVSGGMNLCTGNLEAHQNGLRFDMKRGKKTVTIDVLYSCIKNFILFPSTRNRPAVLHCALHVELPTGRRATTGHIQWWAERGGSGIEGRDDDAEEEEEEEGEEEEVMMEKQEEEEEEKEEERAEPAEGGIEQQFTLICKQISQEAGVTFEEPLYWFKGRPASSNAGLETLACSKQAISHVINTSEPFVINMPDIEVVVLERVVAGGTEFDASFVNKNYSKSVMHISCIPQEYMTLIKDLCCKDYKIVFYETPRKRSWPDIMKKIQHCQQIRCWRPWWEYAPGEAHGRSGEQEQDEDAAQAAAALLGWEQVIDAGDDTCEEDAEKSSEKDADDDDEGDEKALAKKAGRKRRSDEKVGPRKAGGKHVAKRRR